MKNKEMPAGAPAVPGDSELAELGVAAAAAAIRNGDITAESYSAALLRRARDYSDLNSFITIDESAVLAAARDADKARAAGSSAPLLGVPIGVKDSYATRGVRTTLGVETLDSFVPAEDADVVGAIKDAGGHVFGKINLVEMSFGLTGDNSRYGQVKNPYGPEHVPGGSSSGSGASVAARIVPAALGGDTVGSIRVPASLCGVVGFKPTTGRWPRGGVAPVSHTLDTTGILARSVEDAALIDQIVTKDVAVPLSDHPGLQEAKFAYAPRQYMELIDPETEAHFKDALLRLQDAGAEVVEIDLGEDFSQLADRLTWNLFFREAMESVTDFLRRNNFPVSFNEIYGGLKPELKEIWGHLVLPSGQGYISQEAYETTLSVDRPELQRRLGKVFTHSGFDALLFPTTPCPAPTIEHRSRFTVAGEEVDDRFLAKNTVPTSGAGLPGISIPIGLTGHGLPIGLEIDAAHGHDRALLDLARRVESVFDTLPAPA
ncbi:MULTISPECIES: amidase family protein [unclassified Streptomyces]|uniref:amidase family protein n=1 Tax=unclassified Streptomyces TaxID=2593676 RepID=UPI002E80C1CB|nr:amidase family protein [Streptomyces sp. NBC_00562]WTC83944.1 amidase family protein [Streptomyces sp. NBC_01653]WTD86922.1 amidase family protein [Streptomyces sp. NBC_01637]WUC18008.1 amidase family protein [Streptomyces sp. NBC_00562]